MSIPITIGVTGHRDLRSEDIPHLCRIVNEELKKLIDAYPHSRIVMLNSLAEGADQLCAEAALALGISLVAPLPMAAEEYRKDFSGEALTKFERLCSAASEVFVVIPSEPAHEQTREYFYRQAGIYVASHSHVLLALWDGSKATKTGCGTAEAVGFMLNTNYESSGGSLFKATGDGAVIWIVAPRTNIAVPEEAFAVLLLENSKGSLKKVLGDTDSFNKDAQIQTNTPSYPLVALEVMVTLSEKAKTFHTLYAKADGLSLHFRDKYLHIMRILSLFGVGLVLSFLLYDEMESDLFLPVYGIILLLSALCLVRASKGTYHKKYLEYRALAETLRVQFYLLAANIEHDICDSFTWSQKNEIVWAKEAIAALLAGKKEQSSCALENIKAAWIDSQIGYHDEKVLRTGKKEHFNSGITRVMMIVSLALFAVVFSLEFFFSGIMTAVIPFDGLRGLFMIHEGQEVLLRGVFKILLGIISAVTLFLANYYGKLSLKRKLSDHEKMAKLYKAAQLRWDDPCIAKEKLLIELAEEEIIENGVWLSYCRDNTPGVSL